MKLYYVNSPRGTESIDGLSWHEVVRDCHVATLVRSDQDDQWRSLAEHPDFSSANLAPGPDDRITTFERISIVEHYRLWEPPVSLGPAVAGLLSATPRRYLAGLGAVVVTNSSGLNSHRRRSKTTARKRKVAVVQTLGLYHEATSGDPAWIELFADNIFRREPPCVWTIPFWRDWILGQALAHELGHHIHATLVPEFRGKEDVAERWETRLAVDQFKTMHWVAAEYRAQQQRSVA